MASVYRAERLRDGAAVAIKVPLARYRSDTLYLRRFHREAHLALRFDHPNVVRTLEHGSDGPHHAMVMEYLAGEPLDHVLEAANIHRDWACAVVAQVARGLQHIHEHDLVHRDLKAANVMVMPAALRRLGQAGPLPPGAVKIMDFGIAAAASFTALTESARLGTPIAMSPEQASGERVDHRADIYALGLLAYRLFAGQPPFRGSVEAIMQQQVSHTPPPPSEHRTAVSPQLDNLVMRMIAKDRGERPSLAEIIAELERVEGSALSAPGRPRLAVLVREPEASLWQLDLSGVRPPRLLLGPEELGLPAAILPITSRTCSVGDARTTSSAGEPVTMASPPSSRSWRRRADRPRIEAS
jgi:serine/threonine-protein kinase